MLSNETSMMMVSINTGGDHVQFADDVLLIMSMSCLEANTSRELERMSAMIFVSPGIEKSPAPAALVIRLRTRSPKVCWEEGWGAPGRPVAGLPVGIRAGAVEAGRGRATAGTAGGRTAGGRACRRVPPPTLLRALAISSALAYLIGMTSHADFRIPPPESTRSIISNMRFTLATLSHQDQHAAGVRGMMGFGQSHWQGVRMVTISEGLTYFTRITLVMMVLYVGQTGGVVGVDDTGNLEGFGGGHDGHKFSPTLMTEIWLRYIGASNISHHFQFGEAAWFLRGRCPSSC